MTKYIAIFAPTVEFHIEIEANSPEEAWDIAQDVTEEELDDELRKLGVPIFEDSLVSVDPAEED